MVGNTNSEDIDADDIQDDPVKDSQSIGLYQQTFVSGGKNVQNLNKQMEEEHQAKIQKAAEEAPADIYFSAAL